MPEDKLARLPGKPLAVLKRSDGKGTLVINERKPSKDSLSELSAELDKELGERLSDFKKVSARNVNIAAGEGLLYSYVRQKKGTVHTILVVPGKRT